ncbi:hypothetical protein, partial [Thermocatellispora tengchongensis]|uniref:hypothetical protein n=1 Tax=Thermocatellispora tengchongensis TaxID=1073253 RepID=UPI003CD09589
MARKIPTAEQLRRTNTVLGFGNSEEEILEFKKIIEGMADAYRRLDELDVPSPDVKYPRPSGSLPDPEENRLGAWAWKSKIIGAQDADSWRLGQPAAGRDRAADTRARRGMRPADGDRDPGGVR